jgi:hypothetical protein
MIPLNVNYSQLNLYLYGEIIIVENPLEKIDSLVQPDMLLTVLNNYLECPIINSFLLAENMSSVIYYLLSINRPTTRGKENSRSDGHCQ